MAVTISRLLEIDGDGVRQVVATVQMDSSYAAGGEAVALGSLGLQRCTGAVVSPASGTGPVGYVGVWDNANSKLLAFQQDGTTGGLAQASGDLSAVTFTVHFFGV